MERGKLLVKLANEGKLRHVSGEVQNTSEGSSSIIPESQDDNDEGDFREKKLHDAPSCSFQDFESSGSDYIPESECDSEVSTIIPVADILKIRTESSSSKVERYLKTLETTSTQNEVPIEKHKHSICELEYETLSSKILETPGIETISSPFITNSQDPVPSSSKLVTRPSYTKTKTVNSHPNKVLENELSPNMPTSSIQHYNKKACARERPTICPMCYQDVPTHFTRHLFRHHQDNQQVILIRSLKAKSKERLALVAGLRKQGYFYLNTEKNILNPVRTSKDPNTEYFVCKYCLGHYTKKLLYKHVKICKTKPADEFQAGKNCLTKSQTFMASIMSKNQEFLQKSRIKKEVFQIMRPDNISFVAKNDPLICLYGEALLNKHKRQQISTVISNKIREMARLLMAMKEVNNEISGLFDALKPEMFQSLLSATKLISGYDESSKSFKAPSLALHMGTNLKIVCDVAFKTVVEKRVLPNIKPFDRSQKKSDIKDLKKLIEGHWCNELSSLALKTLKERQWETPTILPLSSDIMSFQKYVDNVANDAFEKLTNNIDIKVNYKKLTECVLAQIVMFNRKRVGDVQYLKIETYNSNTSTGNQEAFKESLTNVEKLIINKFKRVVTGGKGSKPIPILFSMRIQKFIAALLKIRTDTNIVPKSNPYLFANPNSENRWMAGVNVIRKLAQNCGVKNPSLLTSTKFRKHIATTLQLMSMEEDEMEQIATFMGHTKKTHAEFYRLPQDIYQTAKVAKVLMLLEKGRGKEFRGKSLNEIELENDVYYSSESEDNQNLTIDTEPLPEKQLAGPSNVQVSTSTPLNKQSRDNESAAKDVGLAAPLVVLERIEANILMRQVGGNVDQTARYQHQQEEESDASEPSVKCKKVSEKHHPAKKISGRVKWSGKEKKLVEQHFRKHIASKIAPKKHECEELLSRHRDVFINKDWVRIKTFVYNTFRGR